MKRVLISHLREMADSRPSGYWEEMLECGRVVGDFVEYENAEYRRLVGKYRTGPALARRVSSFAESAARWAAKGFPVSSSELVSARSAICRECQWWDGGGFGGSGQCRLCGCSTQAKWRMETEVCPTGKW